MMKCMQRVVFNCIKTSAFYGELSLQGICFFPHSLDWIMPRKINGKMTEGAEGDSSRLLAQICTNAFVV